MCRSIYIFPRVADVIDAIKDGNVDFTVTNATPVRAKDINFSQVLLMVELGYMVPADSPITRPEQIDGPGIRIGVSKGGTSERVLAEKYRNAKIIATDSVPDAIKSLRDGAFDVYATNKSILFQMAQSLPGARVLDGNWGANIWRLPCRRGVRPHRDCSTASSATSSRMDACSRSKPSPGSRGLSVRSRVFTAGWCRRQHPLRRKRRSTNRSKAAASWAVMKSAGRRHGQTYKRRPKRAAVAAARIEFVRPV